MLNLKNITKKFNGKTIIDNISMSMAPGQIIVLLGSSGVGKSTILRVLSNLEKIDTGYLELDGNPLDFKKVGMVFQDFNLFPHLTVLENLILPLQIVAQLDQDQATNVAHELLKKFNIDHKSMSYPSQLSGGQKQRVAFARALCLKPSVLCLDEPTSALDPVLTADAAQIIDQIAKQNMIVIIATHDIGLLQNLDAHVFLMQDGKIIQSATTKELKQQSESFKLIKNFMQGKTLLCNEK